MKTLGNGSTTPPTAAVKELYQVIKERYAQERAKRLRADGNSQFVDLYALDKFRRFRTDPWLNKAKVPGDVPHDGDKCEILIIGAGYAGLLFAVRLLQAGFKLSDIRIVDIAGGFGGTWYWNRYPGLMCDIESYIYMPLLEETGYMPKHKYSSSTELREQAERIARKWGLNDRAWFCSNATAVTWDEAAADWEVQLWHRNEDGQQSAPMTVRSRFIVFTAGFQTIPHVPRIPGIEKFQGACFHTARWDYDCTGGSPDNPALTKLKDKRVGIIGTGATSIQAVPALQPWAKELHVFQRTASAVDRRDNYPTDPDRWNREMTNTPGWQTTRRANFNAFLSNLDVKPEVNLVADGWTRMPSYSVLIGNPDRVTYEPDTLASYIDELQILDLGRQEAIRKRVEQVVDDANVAKSLKPWYAGWCKRPCFHDEYLQSFNKPNVTLVDTDGAGLDAITETGVMYAGKEYEVDILILSTGYRSPFLFSPGGRVDVPIKGTNGAELEAKWQAGVGTLHGVMSHDFPNLFFPGLSQSGGTPNFGHCMDISAQHVASILSQATSKMSAGKQLQSSLSGYKYNFTVEVSKAAEDAWTEQVVAHTGLLAATSGCTPSYINAEGEYDRNTSVEELQKRAKAALWGKGIVDYINVLEKWRVEGNLEGIELREA